ncbi:MAG: hypothetical protein AAF734_00560 [Bacteroidota bacterium]
MQLRFFLSHPSFSKLAIEEPVGWSDAKISLVRNDSWHSVSFEYIPEKLQFYRASGLPQILSVYEKEGIDALIGITIDAYDNEQERWLNIFGGKLALHDLEEVKKGKKHYLSCSIESSSLAVNFKNKEDLKVKLAGSEHRLTLTNKTIKLRDEIGYTEGAGDFSFKVTVPLSQTITFANYLFTTNEEIGDVNPLTFPLERLGPINNNPPQSHFIFKQKTRYKISYRLKGTLRESCARTRSYQLTLSGGRAVNLVDNYYRIQSFGQKSVGANQQMTQAFDISGSETFTNDNEGNQFWIYWTLANYNVTGNTVSPLPSTINVTYDSESYIRIEQDSRYPTTEANTYFVHEAFRQIIRQHTGRPAFYSEYFGRPVFGYSKYGWGSWTAITNGLQLRQFSASQKPVYVSFKELFEGMNAIHNLGIGIERNEEGEYLRIEPKSYFYDEAISLSLDGVREVNRSVATAYYVNEVEIGYEKYENEEVNGIDEFCTLHQYAVPVAALQKKLTLKSKLIASGYAIEFTRRAGGEKTTDWKYDHDLFVICLSLDDARRAERAERFNRESGVINPNDSYNLRISPKRNLIRWLNYLYGVLSLHPQKLLNFTYGEINTTLATAMSLNDPDLAEFSGQVLRENQHVNVTEKQQVTKAAQPLFYPEVYEFTYPLSWSQILTLKQKPHQCIAFRQYPESPWKKGVILEISHPVRTGLTEFKLLRR